MTTVTRRASIINQLMRWFEYGVVLGLLPLIAHAIFAYLNAPRAIAVRRILVSAISDGELLLVGCCIGAGALGERIGKSSAWPRVEPLLAASCLACVVIDILTYGIIHAGAVGRKSLIPKVSLSFFGFTVLSSAALMAITFHSRTEKINVRHDR